VIEARHDPFAFARSTAAIPASAMTPSAVSRSMRSLFDRDHVLFGLRGVMSCT
jgi:hypothetical protein